MAIRRNVARLADFWPAAGDVRFALNTWGMGEPLEAPEHGGPLRLIVPAFVGVEKNKR